MSTPRPLRVLLCVSAATLALVSSGRARASGVLTTEFGSDHGQPALANPYDVYFNPGAMAGAHGSEIVVDGTIAAHSMTYDRPASALDSTNTDPTYAAANTGKGTLFNVLGAPYLGFVTDFGGSSLRLGIASYVPFGGPLSWDKNKAYSGQTNVPGAYDGPQRWASISANTSSLYETLALAYRIESLRLGLGASASVIRTGVTDVRARNLDGSDTVLDASGALAEGRSELDVHGIQVGAAAGAYWEATSDGALRIGVSYTSQPGFGTMRLKGTFRQQLTGVAGVTPLEPAEFLEAYPDIVRAGAAWRVAPEVELRFDASWQRWSQFKNQCVVQPGGNCEVDPTTGAPINGDTKTLVNLPRNWHDSAKVRLGGAYWLAPATELFGSVAYETSPTPKANIDALLFDSTRLYATLGVRHAFTKGFAASLSFTGIHFLPVTVDNSAYDSYLVPSRWPSSNGTYSSEVYLVDVALSYRF